MSPAALRRLAAMTSAVETEWRINAFEDWTTIDFRDWPRGFHRSGWVIAGHSGWNPFDVLDQRPPAARAVNALLTRLCVAFALAIVKHVPDPTILTNRYSRGSTPPCMNSRTISPA